MPAERGERAPEVVRQFGGRALRRALLRHVSENEIKRALAAGDLVRSARGLYVLPALPAERAMAAACRGVVSHDSAARLLGLPLLHVPREVHVTVRRGARPAPRKQVVVHQRDLSPGEVVGDVTTPVRTVLDCCLCLPFREALAVADSAARLVPGFVEEFRTAADAPGPGRAARRRVARHVDGRAANPFESALRGSLIDAGMTGFVPQLCISTRTGIARVDLGDPVRRIAVEADSFEWHSTRDALTEDCRRYDEFVRDGWAVLRFAWDHVMFDHGWMVGVVGDVRSSRAG
ncbi:MAG: hypothetical protein WAL50_07915 [Kineosporiaceae bacterium]